MHRKPFPYQSAPHRTCHGCNRRSLILSVSGVRVAVQRVCFGCAIRAINRRAPYREYALQARRYLRIAVDERYVVWKMLTAFMSTYSHVPLYEHATLYICVHFALKMSNVYVHCKLDDTSGLPPTTHGTLCRDATMLTKSSIAPVCNDKVHISLHSQSHTSSVN